MKGIVKIVSMMMAALLLLSSVGQCVVYPAETDWPEDMEVLINEDSPEETVVGAGSTPVIALSRIPDLGKAEPFEGYVFMEDGSALSPEDYHVTMYLQVSYQNYNAYYVKPSAARPFVTIDEEGYFNLTYTSGGDTDKTDFWLLLFPSDHTGMPSELYGDSAFREVCDSALDCVKVERSDEGSTVTPQRDVPDAGEGAPAISALLPVSSSQIAMDVGFYTDEGQQPGDPLSEDQIRMHLDSLKKFSNAVRFYNAGGDISKAYEIANEMGFSVVGTAYLSGNETEDLAELDALIALCNRGLVDVACVGNETLLETVEIKPKLTTKQLIEYIHYVRDRLEDETIPVTTSDSVDVLMSNGTLRKACNLIMPNCYPFWGGADISEAAQGFIDSITSLQAVCGDKQVLVSETGWPTAGGTQGNAAAGEAEAAQYFEEIREWSLSTNTQIFYFASADELWKTNEGTFGTHFGFRTNNFVLKEGYADTTFFKSLDLTGCLHSEVVDEGIEPTCTTTGLTEGSHCRICGEILTKQEEIPALGHDWGEWTVVKEPTSEEDGLERRICRRDASHVETRTLPGTEPVPVIAMTHIPACGERDPFEGCIYMKDGSAFSSDDYHVTLYLQGPYDRWWVKPSAAVTFVTPDENGFFSIPYTSGGDTDKTNFMIFLLPKDHEELTISNVPTSKIEELREKSLDWVNVRRTQEGGISYEPMRQASIESAVITGVSDKTYSGLPQTQDPTVKIGGNTLKKGTLTNGTDFTLSYSNNVNAGTATVTVTGTGKYKGHKSKTFAISKAAPKLTFASASVSKTMLDASFTNELTKTTDGTVTFKSSNTAVASVDTTSGEVTIHGKGTTTITAKAAAGKNYKTGSASFTLTVEAAGIEKASVAGNSLSYGYSGKAYTPAVTVKLNGVTLTKDTDYTIAYKNNVNPGTATITITGIGNYTGTRTKTFEIVDCVSTLVSGRTYQLIPKNNSKTAVSSFGGRMVNNTKVYITDRSNSEAMKFKAVKNADGTWKFINAKCELALAVQQNSSAVGAGLVLYDQTTRPAQNWKLSKKSDNSFAIINSVTGYSIAMSDSSAVKGTTLSMAETASSGLQRFYLAETSAVSAPFDGTKSVRASKDRNFALNIASSSKTDGANVNLYTYSNSNAMKFKIIYSGGGYYRLVNVNSGLCITVNGNTKTDGANVIQSKWAGESGQRWKITENSNGTVTFTNVLGTVLHLNGNKAVNNTNVQARNASTTGAQKWYLN